MRSPARAALALVVVLVTALAGLAAPAQAATDQGLVNGSINCPKLSKCPGIKLLWFDKDWTYIGQRKLGSPRSYSLTLPAGTYHLQFVDQRPSYDVSKYAPTDIQVTVHANDLTSRNVTMLKGAAITGTAVNGKGGPLREATIVAANTAEQSFSTVANKKGQFAVGGLPAGKYSVFTYDKAKTWVGKSTWAGGFAAGQVKNVRVKLPKHAGELTVYLFTPNGLLARKATLTVTSRQTGQWWTDTSSNGTFVFKGLYPGGYNAKFDGAGVWFAATGAVQDATVKSNKPAFGKFRITKRGGWITGAVLDGGGSNGPTSFAMEGVRVGLYDAAGHELATAVSDADGNFTLDGQLATQDGLTITVEPNPNGGGWMKAAAPDNWCLFEGSETGGYSITQGQETFVNTLSLPRSTDSGQSTQCLT